MTRRVVYSAVNSVFYHLIKYYNVKRIFLFPDSDEPTVLHVLFNQAETLQRTHVTNSIQ